MKTSELSDKDLDWAVAVSLGLEPVLRHDHLKAKALANNYKGDLDWYLQGPNDPITVAASGATRVIRNYHEDWSLSGPIIEREGISTIKLEPEYGVDSEGYTTTERIPVFGAVVGEYFDTDLQRNSYGEAYGEIYCIGTELVTTGPTPLIAAMRCFVSVTLGDEVEIPEIPKDLYASTHPRNAKKLAS